VLVEPSHPGNVGAAARALKTMGFSRLVLVSPRVADVKNDPEAIAMASGADDVLASAHVVPTLADALSGAHWSLALTARAREYGPPQLAPRAAATQAREHAVHGDIALVFGNERTGLENSELQLCHAAVHIPSAADFPSLNLAQAVQLLAWEVRRALLDSGPVPAAGSGEELATGAQLEHFFTHLAQTLDDIDFHKGRSPVTIMKRLRRLFLRSALEQREVRILRGIFDDAQRMARLAKTAARPPDDG